VPDLAHLFLNADHLLAMLAMVLWALSLGLVCLPSHRLARLAGVPVALAGSWLLVRALS
jgi:hydrogenase/urease accessory protein HupE